MNSWRAFVRDKLCDLLTRFLQFLASDGCCPAYECHLCSQHIWKSGVIPCFTRLVISPFLWDPFGKTVVWPVCIMAAGTGLYCFDCFIQLLFSCAHTQNTNRYVRRKLSSVESVGAAWVNPSAVLSKCRYVCRLPLKEIIKTYIYTKVQTGSLDVLDVI